jgi:hypothetical protein
MRATSQVYSAAGRMMAILRCGADEMIEHR